MVGEKTGGASIAANMGAKKWGRVFARPHTTSCVGASRSGGRRKRDPGARYARLSDVAAARLKTAAAENRFLG